MNHQTATNPSYSYTAHPAVPTFRQTAEAYLIHARDTIASTTYDRYLDVLERDIYPEYADTPIRDVTEEEIDRFLRNAPDIAKKSGRTLTRSSLLVAKSVIGNVISFSKKTADAEKISELGWERVPYEELSRSELEMICLRAKHNRCPEMLAALLSLFCGMRTGELCALNSDDVDVLTGEIYIHRIVHRVRNPKRGEAGEKKTVIIVEEIARKKQIRRVSYPAAMSDYIEEFRSKGKPLIRATGDDKLTDPRTLENRLARITKSFGADGINFERLRKTYIKGKADEQMLNNIFSVV